MSKKSVEEMLRQLEKGAGDVRSAGDELTQRIKTFESWLAKLPGRVPADCMLWSDDNCYERFLQFTKDGKNWCLRLYTSHLVDEFITDVVLLRDASISEKTMAMERFSDLLIAIAKRQEALVTDAKKSIAEFDQFAASVGIKKEDV